MATNILGETLPNTLISQVVLQDGPTSNTEDSVLVRFQSVVKELLKKGNNFSWFDDEEMTKYLNLKVVQVLNNRPYFEAFVKGGDLSQIPLDGVEEFSTPIKEIIAVKSGRKFRIAGRGVVTVDGLPNFEKQVDKDGNQFYEIPLEQIFSIEDNIDFLGYIAYSFFDTQAMSQDLKIPIEFIENVKGQPSSEIIIDNGKVSSTSFVFVLPNGEQWIGPVHVRQGVNAPQVWTKSRDAGDSVQLTVLEVANYKVQDYRQLKRSTQKVRLSEQLVTSISQANLNYEVARSYTKKNYFTDNFLSRDKDGRCKFLFGFDFWSLIKDNSSFKFLYDNLDNAEINKILNKAMIRNLKVLRRRVRKTDYALNSLGSPVQGFTRFDKEEVDTLVTSMSQGSDEKLVLVDSDNGYMIESAIADDSQVVKEVRYFTGFDNSMKKVTDGLYQYIVELEIDDPTATYIGEKIDQAREIEQFMDRYLSFASKSDFYNFNSQKLTEKFFKVVNLNDFISELSTRIYDYVELREIFNVPPPGQVFKRDSDVKGELSMLLLPILDPSSATLENIETFSRAAGEMKAYIENLAGSVLGRKIDSMSESSAIQRTSTSSSKSIKRTFDVSNTFGQTFDSDVPRETGLEIFLPFVPLNFAEVPDEELYAPVEKEDSTQWERIGLLSFNVEALIARADEETNKFFTSKAADINLATQTATYTTDDTLENNKFAFFTPRRAEICGMKNLDMFDQGKAAVEPVRYNSFSTAVTLFNSSLQASRKGYLQSVKVEETSDKYPSDEVELSNALSSLFAQGAVTIAGTNKTERKSAKQSKKTPSEYLLESVEPSLEGQVGVKSESQSSDAPVKAQQSVKFNSALSSLATKMVYGRKGNDAQYRNNLKTNFDLNSEKNSVDKSKQPQEFVKALPNQLKSLLLSSAGSSEVRVDWFGEENPSLEDPENFTVFDLTYANISKVEILTGYAKNSENSNIMKLPRWEKLERESFNRLAQNGNEFILGRLSKYENNTLGIGPTKNLNLPIYDEYFIIDLEDAKEFFVIDVEFTTKEEEHRRREQAILDMTKSSGTVAQYEKPGITNTVLILAEQE